MTVYGRRRDEDQDAVSGLELPWLGRPVVVTLLGFLGFDQMFPYERHDPFNPLPHVPDVLDRRPMGGWLLLPGLFGDIEEAAGLPAEEEFEWGETRGGLGNLPDAEQDVGQHSVPVAFVVSSHPTEHLLQRLVKSFHQPIGLWVVDCGAELLNLEKAAQVGHRPGHEGGALVGQYLLGNADPATQ